MEWSTEQLDAINIRDRRLLVSAAAGSGKTAVLVERILRRILDKNDPCDIDELLVMTFTKAAASEMKKRIRERLAEEKDYRQMTLIENSFIQTIDAFCSRIVKEHTDELDLDPTSRIAEEEEINLIRQDVLAGMLEEYYETADNSFIDFVEKYTVGNDGRGLEEIILDLYNAAQGSPYPGTWYEDQLNGKAGEAAKSYLYENMILLLDSLLPGIDSVLELCREEHGLEKYRKTIEEDRSVIAAMTAAPDLDKLTELLNTCSFGSLSPVRDDKCDVSAKEEVKSTREGYKTLVTGKLKPLVCSCDIAENREAVRTIVSLTKDFDERFTAAKREKNVLDFNDLEHMAIRIAPHYRGKFREILIDEYQDSNDVQEELLKNMDDGNVFMVGDVKQSIYKFRKAKPGLFNRKYNEYRRIDATGRGIDTVLLLNRNYRSGKKILEEINSLFSRIMHKELGGIDYTDEVRLNPGEGNTEGSVRVLMADTEGSGYDDDIRETEAQVIAEKIKELADEGTAYKDMAILLRSTKNVSDIFLNTLLNNGIPAVSSGNKGYFDSLEIKIMLSIIEAIDNPYKDIPMAALLRSPVINMSNDELAVLITEYRNAHRDEYVSVYDAVKNTKGYKTGKAAELIERYSRMAEYSGPAELISTFYDETGYYDYCLALPSGNIRKANLDRLLLMAEKFAGTGYRGLFNFIRYINDLKSYDTDFAEGTVTGENDNAVRIMSIHRSKGLEFPVCFVSAMDRKFNFRDETKSVLVDDELGIACESFDTDTRIRKKTLKQNAIRFKIKNDTLGEELRILYVAMTRAKEKLILTGCTSDAEKFTNAWDEERGDMPLHAIRNAVCFMDWIVGSGVKYPLTVIPFKEREETRENDTDLKKLKEKIDSATVSPGERDELDRIFEYRYPFEEDTELRNKISVSEIKRMHMEETAEITFAYGSEGGGSERGTRYHKVMEKLDYNDPYALCDDIVKKEDIELFINSELGMLCRDAFISGRLYREKQFIMGLTARELGLADSEETVLVQGIIDAYIEQEDSCILLDYKTDRVKSGEELIKRYRQQLHYYGMAIEKMKRKKADRMYIWSFCLGKMIKIN